MAPVTNMRYEPELTKKAFPCKYYNFCSNPNHFSFSYLNNKTFYLEVFKIQNIQTSGIARQRTIVAGITAAGRNIGVAIAMDSGTRNFQEKCKRLF